jgi:predicted small lipoprotein YifL
MARIRNVRDRHFSWFVCSLILLAMVGCGRKGPPMAPKYVPPKPVVDLRAELKGETAILRWTRPSGAEDGGYWIYRAATTLGGDECGNCPLLFQKVGRVTSEGNLKDFLFHEMVVPGFRYTYKIRPMGDGADTMPDSNPATVHFPIP